MSVCVGRLIIYSLDLGIMPGEGSDVFVKMEYNLWHLHKWVEYLDVGSGYGRRVGFRIGRLCFVWGDI